MTPAWHRAIAYALTGADLPLGEQDAPAAAQLVTELAVQGWDPDRVRAVKTRNEETGRPWPVPVPAAVREGLGAAQFLAALSSARQVLGLAGNARPPAAPRSLTADERRLLGEVPPHHGH